MELETDIDTQIANLEAAQPSQDAAEILKPSCDESQLKTVHPNDEAIAVLAEKYMPLQIDGVADSTGYAVVHAAEMDIKGKRVAVEKWRVKEKAPHIDYGRKVEGEAKRLTALLTPIEMHLRGQKTLIDDEKARIRNAAKLKAEEEERQRIAAEEAERKRIADAEAAKVKAEQDAENERIRVAQEKLDAAQKELEAKEAKLVADQKELEAKEAKLVADQQAIKDETDRLADIEAKRVEAKELEQAKAKAAEQARIDTEARIAREAEEKAAKEKADAEAAEAAKLRVEKLRPDREKLMSVSEMIKVRLSDMPQVKTEAGEVTLLRITAVLQDARENILRIIGEME